MQSALARELRENAGYLKDDGWAQSAALMTLAADEIDRLTNERARAEFSAREFAARREPLLGPKVRSMVARVFAVR